MPKFKYVTYKDLTHVQQKALDAADHASRLYPYCPYSKFYVGAALYTHDGREVVVGAGANIENAAYGSTICAERVAICVARMSLRKFVGIAIIAHGKDFDTTDITGPCGSCRQNLFEFAQLCGIDPSRFKVVLSTTKMDKIIVTNMGELLPLGFGPLNLGIDISEFQK
ncbi:MAG: cytidine deaminase [Candidatus Paceibacterota bacterium]|jgi:cytidine deaminase